MGANRTLIKKYKEVNTGEVSLPASFHHAEGNYVYDNEGNSFLDFTSGFGVTSTGWLREEIAFAFQEQLKKSAYAPPWLPTEEAVALSELLLSITPPNLIKCARAVSGSDANEIIYKAVFAARGKKEVISFKRSYHGGTHFSLSISDKEAFHLPNQASSSYKHFVEPPYCYRCPFGKEPSSCNLECTKKIEDLLQNEKEIGSVFIEPIIGSGGVIIPPQKYFERIRQLCSDYNIFLVFDEVITGFGRAGKITACELFGCTPDAISFGKGIGSGYIAIGAALLNAELSNALLKSEDVSSSLAWSPLSCAVATANINLILKNELPRNATIQGNYLLTETKKVFQKYFPEQTGDVRGIGLMIGIELVETLQTKTPNKKLMQKFVLTTLSKGLMVCASWDFKVIIIMPPLNISTDEIKAGLDKMETALKVLSR